MGGHSESAVGVGGMGLALHNDAGERGCDCDEVLVDGSCILQASSVSCAGVPYRVCRGPAVP